MSYIAVFALFTACIISHANVEAYRVLGVFPTPTYSHFSLGARYMNELAARGHDVTFINPYPDDPKAKYRSIELTGVPEMLAEMSKEFNQFEMSTNALLGPIFVHSMGNGLTEKTLSHPAVQKLLNDKNEKFDVIILSMFVNDAFRGFCAHYNASCILSNSVRSVYWTNIAMGNPSNPAYDPDMLVQHEGRMDFWTRLRNTLISGYVQLYYLGIFIPQQNALMQQYFPGKLAPLSELLHKVDVMFLNSDISSAPPMPLLPNMVEIGGYHVKEPKKLPDDIQKYLDGAKNGVIYFSMGSNLKSKDIPEAKKAAILKALGTVKEDVLWKFEVDLPGKPKNVRIQKWFPQSDILAHPNVKLFITHGGLLGTLESIYHGMPVLGLPVYGDQESNMLRAEEKGYGVKVSFKEITEEKLTNALKTLLNNPSYKQTAVKYSKLMHDRPMKPIDTAMFWIDYAVRHKGETHFRSAALDLAWYQYYLLDVMAVLALIGAASTAVFVYLVKLCCSKKKASKVKKQ